MDAVNVLVSLTKGYGLGDAVLMSAVLKHVRKYRPHWIIDFQAEPGRQTVGIGIAHNVFCYGEPYPSEHYDAEVQIILYATFPRWYDRPNTRVTACLHERFGLEWDRECGRYSIQLRDVELDTNRCVAIHYAGDSAKHMKDLSFKQAEQIAKHILSLGLVPLVLDFRPDPLSKVQGVKSVNKIGSGADASIVAGIIAKCKAFIGIDSGPSKCASATETPSLIVWTTHHPAAFHDPAPNTTHLVPIGYHGFAPVNYDAGVVAWFETNYNIRLYDDDPVLEIKRWLTEKAKSF